MGLLGNDGRPLRELPPITIMEDGPCVRVRFSTPEMVFSPENALKFALGVQVVAKKVLLRLCGLPAPPAAPTTESSDAPPPEE